jgi:serine/threonine-protein kinase HipA
MVDVAKVYLWDDLVGAVAWQGDALTGHGVFEFDSSFLKKGLDLSPVKMGLAEARRQPVFSFRGRPARSDRDTFKGLPGLLADALPDKFGNAVIDAWLARQGRDISSFTPVERLCYVGTRAMGALEFKPALNQRTDKVVPVEISHLVDLARKITSHRNSLDVTLTDNDEATNQEALLEILRVGTSAGGARAKAVIALNGDGHIMSGQANVPDGYEHWLLKFDGANDLEFGKTDGYGRIEYAYYLMAKACGINMMECRLLEEGGRAHFMTKRFDRQNNKKLHMQSLCGLGHYDYNVPGAYSYEQAFSVMRKLRLPKKDAAQQFRRMVFNVLARNQDDHTKNLGFLMDKSGVWSLSPAYDVMFAYKPGNEWIDKHQMTINGKQDHFTLDDFKTVASSISLSNSKEVIEEVKEGVSQWQRFAKQAGVDSQKIQHIQKSLQIVDRQKADGALENDGDLASGPR